MGRGRPLAALALSAQENNQLVEWTRRGKTSQALALRARIVLGCAQGTTNGGVARSLQVTPQTVGKWRSRFLGRRRIKKEPGVGQTPGCRSTHKPLGGCGPW